MTTDTEFSGDFCQPSVSCAQLDRGGNDRRRQKVDIDQTDAPGKKASGFDQHKDFLIGYAAGLRQAGKIQKRAGTAAQ